MRMTMAMTVSDNDNDNDNDNNGLFTINPQKFKPKCQPENVLFVIGFCLKNHSSPRPFCLLYAQGENLGVTIFFEQELLIW